MLDFLKYTLFIGLFLAVSSVNAVPIQINEYNVVADVNYSDCDKAGTALVFTSTCEKTIDLSKPDVQFQDTHDLDNVVLQFYFDVGLEAKIVGQDPDWGNPDPLDLSSPENIFGLLGGGTPLADLIPYDSAACYGLFVDCRIDATWAFIKKLDYALSSGVINISDTPVKESGTLSCEDADPFGIVGFGTCGAAATASFEPVVAEFGIYSDSDIANFISSPLTLALTDFTYSLLTGATDDQFDLRLSVSPYFEINVIYNYTDKLVVEIDEPEASTVPESGSLALLIAGLISLGFARRRKA